MKFTLISLYLVIFNFLPVMAGKVEHVYHFRNPSIKENGAYQRFELSNTILTALPGEPALPYQQVRLMLPPGETAVTCEISFSEEIILPGKYNIYPQQAIRSVSEGSSGIFLKNKEVYARDADFPASEKGKLVTSVLNGHSFALTSFTPVRYNPVTGRLSYFAKAILTVNTVQDKTLKSAGIFSARNLQAAKLADNKEMELAYSIKQSSVENPYDILVICTAEFGKSFEGYKANYLKLGLKSKVATLDSITATMNGIDVPEKIRNYIIQEYRFHEIQYVLLAGDAELIPYRGLYCYVQSGSGYTDNSIPSDIYYSALDGNWNADGDALWGEPAEGQKADEADLLPDVAVGRIPFSNLTELESILNKSFKYQFSPVPGEFRNILMAGEKLFFNPETWGSDFLEMLKGNHSDNGYTTKGIPLNYNFDNLYDETAVWGGTDIINRLKLGRPMVNHNGHSTETSMMRLNNSNIIKENFASLNGVEHNFTFVYSHGCLCGAFDRNDCIAEKIVTIENFAVAFVGNSRYGWFNEGQTEGPSLHLHREFINTMFGDSLNRIGVAHMESKIASAAWVTAPGQWEPGALRWCFYGCNVLGDPALSIFTDNPFTIVAKYPSTVKLGTFKIDVNASSSGKPVSHLVCVVLKDGSIRGKSKTDVSGNAVINFDVPVQESGEAELVVSGYNCTPKTYKINLGNYTSLDKYSDVQEYLSLYPNPASDFITVGILLGTESNYDLRIYDIIGGLCYSKPGAASESNGYSKTNIDISKLPPGLYTCEVLCGKNKFSKRFIVH